MNHSEVSVLFQKLNTVSQDQVKKLRLALKTVKGFGGDSEVKLEPPSHGFNEVSRSDSPRNVKEEYVTTHTEHVANSLEKAFQPNGYGIANGHSDLEHSGTSGAIDRLPCAFPVKAESSSAIKTVKVEPGVNGYIQNDASEIAAQYANQNGSTYGERQSYSGSAMSSMGFIGPLLPGQCRKSVVFEENWLLSDPVPQTSAPLPLTIHTAATGYHRFSTISSGPSSLSPAYLTPRSDSAAQGSTSHGVQRSLNLNNRRHSTTSDRSSPVYFTFIGPPAPVEPPEEARRRRSKFADPIAPVVYDLYQEVQARWPGAQMHLEPMVHEVKDEPDEAVLATDDYALLQGASAASGKAAPVAPPTEIAGLPLGPNGMPERVRSDVPIEPVVFSYRQTIAAVRLLMRKKMHRCKVCKNRFVEKDLFERHMREKHPLQFEKYVEVKAKQDEQSRLEYLDWLQVQREIEERRNQRLAEKYERLFEENRRREVDGLPKLTLDELYPPRPKRPRPVEVVPEVEEPPQLDGVVCAGGDDRRNKRKRYRRRICPQCPFCDRRFKNDISMRKHLARKHPDAINFVQCNKCYKCVRTQDELDSHVCDINWICLECTPIRNMVTAERLNTHKKKFHRGDKSGFKCTECERKFQTPRKLRKHQKSAHALSGHYKCQFCEEFFTTDTQVALHERVHTGKVRFECNICDFKTNRTLKLDEHRKEDHGYLCVQCSAKFVEWNDLKVHFLDKHEGYLSAESQAVMLKLLTIAASPSPIAVAMQSSTVTGGRVEVLRLYKELIRQAQKLDSYNFREYARRRIRSGFRENITVTDPTQTAALRDRAASELAVLKRQVIIGNMYSGPKLVVERLSDS